MKIHLAVINVDILTLLQTFIASFFVALIEYVAFSNYDGLSREKKAKNTFIWAILTNIIIILSSVVFEWFPPLPIWAIILLFIVLQLSIVAMRYSIYVVNLSDTKDLNSKLQKYQQDTSN